ncbi:hypothetical protein [Corynebacterium urogenitale]
MKKTSFAIAGACTLLLAACGDAEDTAGNAASSATSAAESMTSKATTTSKSPATPSPAPGDEDGAADGAEQPAPQPPQNVAAPAPAPAPAPGDGSGNADDISNEGGNNKGGGNGGDQPYGTPVVAGPCSLDQLLQPGVTADGTNVVCIRDSNNDSLGIWVKGPAPTGQVARRGDQCDDGYPEHPGHGDKGAVDAQGRIMMCVGDQWTYGP